MKPFVLTLLRTILFCLAAWLTGASDAPVVAASEIPPISSQTYIIDVTSSGRAATNTDPIVLGPESPEHAFNGIQLTWTVVGDPNLLRLELITQQDGVWGEWMEVPHEDEFLLDDAPAGTQTSTIYTVEPIAQAWQIRISTPDTALATVTSIRVTTMDTRDQTEARSELPAATEPLSAGAKPAIVARATWGDTTVKRWDANGSAGLSTEATWMPTDAEIAKPTHLIIHHTATPNAGPGSNWPERVRQIWRYHTLPQSNNWGDIGYHFLIDPNGVIYEGRYQGLRADGTVIDGAHSYRFNRGTVGIAMLGTFESVAPTKQSQAALDNLIAYLMTRHRIQPNATAFYAHQRMTLNTLVGHRDAQLPGRGTACPGDTLYALLPSIRLKARAAVGTAPAQQWLTGVTVTNTEVMVGDPVVFRMFVRNAYADAPISGGAFAFPVSDNSYVYQLNECWAKQNAGGTPLFPKASVSSNRYGRFRVMAGVNDWDTQYANQPVACPVSSTENHPWRWSIGATPLAAGQTRVISGGVSFTKPGTYTVSFGVMKDWIGYPDNACSTSPTYAACVLFPKTITVRTRQTPIPTLPPALKTQIAHMTTTAGAATAIAATAKTRLTQTAILGELTATAASAAGKPTYTASATPTSTTTASAIPIQQTAQRYAGATQTSAARQTVVATTGAHTPTMTRTPTRSPVAISFVKTSSIRTQKAINPVLDIAALGTTLVVLEAGSPAQVALYDAVLLKRIQGILIRGTSGLVLTVDDQLPDTVYVAGNYTPNYIFLQRFRLVNGTLRETGYWLTAQTGVPTSVLASGTNVTLAIHDTARRIHQLVRIDTKNLFREGAPRLAVPGFVTSLINSDGVGRLVVAAGTLPLQNGFILPVTYQADGTTQSGSRITTSQAFASLCRSWQFRGVVPVALIAGADDTTIRSYTHNLNTNILSGPASTTAGAYLMRCPAHHASFVLRIRSTAGTLSVLQPIGSRFEIRATANLPRVNRLAIRGVAVFPGTLIWTDGINISNASIAWPR